ncbi:YncE family protein [Clostridium sp. BJN0001]|uniref:YncE family protein n=1 Tax=Clostridium sp. BJN0001 TaxID=2930219 RepID=UPI001FD1E6C8|nr:YncE family protein [Clostridium sp. BJN0001]
MSSVILCNNGNDDINVIDVKKLVKKRIISSCHNSVSGHHGLIIYRGDIYTTDNLKNSITKFSLASYKYENYYIGAHPNDIAIFNLRKAYICCGESDSVILFNLRTKMINIQIPVGRQPHSIELYNERRRIFVGNMGENTVSVINCFSDHEIKRIKVRLHPVKLKISRNRRYLYICSADFDKGKEGSIEIISLAKNEVVYEIRVGFCPSDIFEDENNLLYVTNFLGECISIIDLKEKSVVKNVYIGGMPKSILKINQNIFISDYENGKIDILSTPLFKKIKSINIGPEPNNMLFINKSFIE